MTTAGPEPLETMRSPIDYAFYVSRQLQPVADAILPFLRDDFERVISGQGNCSDVARLRERPFLHTVARATASPVSAVCRSAFRRPRASSDK
jgi:hypothetical protein